MEPVDAGAIRDGREAAAAHAKRRTNGGEAQNDLANKKAFYETKKPWIDFVFAEEKKNSETCLQITSNPVEEVTPTAGVVVVQAVSFDFIAQSIDNVLDLIRGKEVGHFSRREEIVDEDEEGLVGHLAVSHEKDDALVFQASPTEHLSQIGLEKVNFREFYWHMKLIS